MSEKSHPKNIRPRLRTLEQIRDDILHKRDQLVRDMIAASSTPRGGSGRPRGVQIDEPHKGAAWLIWGQRYVVDADYVLPRLVWLYAELGMHGVPDLPPWPVTGEPKTEHEALGYLNTLLACCEGALHTPDKQQAGGASNDVPADKFDKLTSDQRKLVHYLDARENKQASIRDAMKHFGKSHASNRERRSFLAAVRRLNGRLADHYPHLEVEQDRTSNTLTLIVRPQTNTKATK